MPQDKTPFDVPLSRGGRPLKVLHIGNIANNAYYNAKFLRRAGVEADVLCHDDYWIMSSPEWEEADFDGVPSDHYHPDWWSLDLKGYERPRWFVQGPFELCVAYLLAKQQGNCSLVESLWIKLTDARRKICNPSYNRVLKTSRTIAGHMPGKLYNNIRNAAQKFFARRNPVTRNNTTASEDNLFHQEYAQRCQWLISEFARRFPDRPDHLTLDELLPYEPQVKLLKGLFRYYDLVQGYSVYPLLPMLAGFKPYVAFEHGTLRDAPEAKWEFKGPFHANTIGRLTALSYALADHVFITNADCLASARRLGLEHYDPLPHPLDEAVFNPTDEHRDAIRKRCGSNLVFFCPIRHDWIDKGTDLYIRAIPKLSALLGNEFKVCFTPWGREIDKSRALIAELGCADRVLWEGPFGAIQFARWLSAADVVFDQLVYPSFSGLTPRALACGVPIIAAYNPDSMAWMFPEPAPILTARSVEDIVRQTMEAVRPGFRGDYAVRSRQWIERNHSSRIVLERMLRAYGRVLNAAN